MSYTFIFFMKGKLREDLTKYIPYYWIASLTAYMKLSRNCVFLPTDVLAKAESILLSDCLQHWLLIVHETKGLPHFLVIGCSFLTSDTESGLIKEVPQKHLVCTPKEYRKLSNRVERVSSQ